MVPNLKANITITHIGTATAVIEIDGINFLTDPFFSTAGTEWDEGIAVLKVSDDPALKLQDLPIIDVVLLSHEDHPDNLDELGRRLLDGRRVLTTMDGAQKLAPRPGVIGMRPWEVIYLYTGGRHFQVTATPCQHIPGGECTGFILTTSEFGETNGLPNAIYFSGDTVYMPELSDMSRRFHIRVAILNLGAAKGPFADSPLLITMDGKQASQLFREIKADILVPMHYESWGHFTENGDNLEKVFKEEGIYDKVCWLTPGKPKVL
ncbi:zn-dependent hydrolases of the beta-lactamase [Colletotrichum incanum]|uniref:Zn-dependent hydrolases of the beta-lactamase n=1 Tax=Colletotrichum incanum TaxID=1573173 RepID=A0A162PL22_COLIC|nr:zn-dependent hydrolases of the beta-lactamase [Colletotrichum incanum]OHW96077.1 zn-dependent hydrolases of the beta-lactamase [Colletotrichum incanum]